MLRAVAIGLTGVVLTAKIATAHVAPAARENNRYLSITPMGDRIQVSYTIFYGQIPGLELRAKMDRDRSGQISDEEIASFAEPIARAVAEALSVSVDARAVKLSAWHRVGARLGEPTTSGGAFELVMVTFFCLSQDRDEHELSLHDRYRLDRPGEGELRLDTAPGIRVLKSGYSGALESLSTKLAWEGNDGPLANVGYALRFRANAKAFRSDTPCESLADDESATRAPPNQRPKWLLPALAGGAALCALATFLLLRRRKRARAPRA